jgi:acetoin:2,6-dichlorophenolindophenol oxidoreductase subunit beta
MTMSRRSFLEAIHDAQEEEMTRDGRVFIMGEDVVANVFGTTGGLAAKFGKERVRDTPISEAGFVGAAAGAAMVGMRPVVDMNIASFIYPAMDQVVSIIAKSRYLYGGQARLPMVIRLTMLYNSSTAAQHSDRPYPMLMGIPGLKIVVPSSALDMKGLLKSAIRDDDPVIIFEDSTLGSSKMELPDDPEFLIPLGKADVKREGKDITIVAIGGSVPLALAAATSLANDGISAEVVDPRSLVPLDEETILRSVRKTGRVVIVDPANRTCSAASEIAAIIAESAFASLRAPVLRITTPATHIPFSGALESQLYPSKANIIAAVLGSVRLSPTH